MILALSRSSVQDLEEIMQYPSSLADFHQPTTSAVNFSRVTLRFATHVPHRGLLSLASLQLRSVHWGYTS